jgi:hypothetical protein
MATKRMVKRVKTVRKASLAKRVKAARPKIMKKAKPRLAERFAPRVLYVGGYLRLMKPDERASEIEKQRYAFALACVKEMADFINEEDPDILRHAAGRPCLGGWPLVPPLGLSME